MDAFFEKEQISFDKLTGLYDKETIIRYAENLISRKNPFSLAIIDIDNFKYITDSNGDDIGDKLLCEVASRIKNQVGSSGYVAHSNRDEFLVVFPDAVSYDGIWQSCHNLLASVSESEFSTIEGLHVTVTIGLSRFPENSTTCERLFEAAEKALYRGKVKGRNCFIIYLPEKHANIIVKTEKEKQISSMYLHSIVFNHLTKTKNLADGINHLFDFVGSYYNIDHLCIQSDSDSGEKLFFEKIHPLVKFSDFSPIRNELVKENLNKTIEILYINDIKSLLQLNRLEFYDSLKAQHITSACFVNIAYQGKSYGILRAEMIGKESHKTWQYGDMDILITIANTIALILYFTEKTIYEL